MSDTQEQADARIAAAWPDRWAKANDPRPGASKRRNRVRRHWQLHCALEKFKKDNPTARCGTCANYQMMPLDDRRHCEVESDFYGYLMTKPDSVCMKWKG